MGLKRTFTAWLFSRRALGHLFTGFLLVFCVAIASDACAADILVYGDALAAGWENWSWGTTINFSAASPVHAGSAAMSVQYGDLWTGLYLHDSTNIEGYQVSALRFWANGGSGGAKVRVMLYDENLAGVGDGVLLTLTANTWQKYEMTLSALGSPGKISGIAWQESSNGSGPPPKFYLDDITLIASNATPTPTPTPAPGPALSVDAAAGRHPISPLIYGMNFADEVLATELRLPVCRWGGNATTRYNWKNDTSNHASDWYFENIPNDNADPSKLPDGSSSDLFVEQNRRSGTRSIITVPLIGWTPKSRDYAGGFSVSKYGAQQSTDSWRPDCGNGVKPDGTAITGNDPQDTSTAIDPTFVRDWINHLKGRYGAAATGGVAFYNLDNEPMLWNSTHRDVHPGATSYDELRDRTIQYAAAIKAADPTAATLGPVLWGWSAYFYSALDAAAGGAWWNNPQDRNAHGGTPFIEWYLQQMRAYEQAHGVRILDYVDIHYYPQASGVSLSGAGNAQTQALRLRSTRGLWDPAYTDESWIGEPVRLIPRMHEWVNDNYPGTKLALTEYNWGALDHINGALAQADVLGLFGREGLDLATLWGPPTAGQPGAYAFRMYLNYDGAHGTFGEEGVSAASSDPDRLAVYAARRSADGALTLMIVNKSTLDQTAKLNLAGFRAQAKAKVYRYSAANLAAIVRQPDIDVAAGGFTVTYPVSSITLIVLGESNNAARDWTLY